MAGVVPVLVGGLQTALGNSRSSGRGYERKQEEAMQRRAKNSIVKESRKGPESKKNYDHNFKGDVKSNKKVTAEILPYAQPSFDYYGRSVNHYKADLDRDMARQPLNKNWPRTDKAGRAGLGYAYGLVRGAFDRHVPPSAVTRTDGGVSKEMPGRGRGRGRGRGGRGFGKKFKKEVKKEVKKDLRQALNPMVVKAGFKREGYRGGGRIIRAPISQGKTYRGGDMRILPMRKSFGGSNMNCSRLTSRVFIGSISKEATSGETHWYPNGTGNTYGQWFFMPSNAFYWPASSNSVTMARMYQFFFLQNVSFEFESSIQPGLTTNYKTYYGFIEDPNVGETYIAGYTTTQNVTSANILQNPVSKSFPTWQLKTVVSPPRRWYANKKYAIRTYAVNQALDTSTSSVAAENKGAVPFGFWVNIVGATPATSFYACDVFIKYTVEFCDMAPYQTLDNTGGSTYSSSSVEKKGETSVGSPVKLTAEDLEDFEPPKIVKPVSTSRKSTLSSK